MKVNDTEHCSVQDLSKPEIIVLNWWLFGQCSLDICMIVKELGTKHRLRAQYLDNIPKAMLLKNVYQSDLLLGKQSESLDNNRTLSDMLRRKTANISQQETVSQQPQELNQARDFIDSDDEVEMEVMKNSSDNQEML